MSKISEYLQQFLEILYGLYMIYTPVLNHRIKTMTFESMVIAVKIIKIIPALQIFESIYGNNNLDILEDFIILFKNYINNFQEVVNKWREIEFNKQLIDNKKVELIKSIIELTDQQNIQIHIIEKAISCYVLKSLPNSYDNNYDDISVVYCLLISLDENHPISELFTDIDLCETKQNILEQQQNEYFDDLNKNIESINDNFLEITDIQQYIKDIDENIDQLSNSDKNYEYYVSFKRNNLDIIVVDMAYPYSECKESVLSTICDIFNTKHNMVKEIMEFSLPTSVVKERLL